MEFLDLLKAIFLENGPDPSWLVEKPYGDVLNVIEICYTDTTRAA